MDNKILRTGLIGCGHLGKIHCRILNEIAASNQNIKFTGVFDINTSSSEEMNKAHGVHSFASEDELLDHIDALIIVTPTSTHFDIASKALAKNINIFIEKPVTRSVKEAKELSRLAESSDLKIQVGHVERFNPALTSLEKTDIKPLFIESHRLSQFNPRGTDVSVIQDLMIHDIDIILHLVNSPITKIDANGVAVISDEIDIANARLSFKNGCVANLTASRISIKKMRKMRIFQHNAYISIDFLNNRSEVFRLADSDKETSGMSIPVSDSKKIIFENPAAENKDEINPIKNELEAFFKSILLKSQVKVTLEDGKEAVAAAEEIIRIISDSDRFHKGK